MLEFDTSVFGGEVPVFATRRAAWRNIGGRAGPYAIGPPSLAISGHS